MEISRSHEDKTQLAEIILLSQLETVRETISPLHSSEASDKILIFFHVFRSVHYSPFAVLEVNKCT